MVHIIKIYFQDQNNEKQIRRLAVNSEVVGKYGLLVQKIKEIFPCLVNKQFQVTWRDPENDVIHMSSDDELAQALANAEEGLLRIYIYVAGQMKTEEIPKPISNHTELHPHVVCDACNKNISGYRYKCLQCRDFDVCSDCNAANKHAEHDMIKLYRPTNIPREWVFLGARKMWRSMFGRCPSSYFHNCQQQKKEENVSASSSGEEKSEGQKANWQKVFDSFMKGEFVPAENLVKENLGTFLNFVDSFAGGVDVKIENPPFPPKSFSTKFETNGDSSKTETTSSPQKSNDATPEEKSSTTEKKIEIVTDRETPKSDDKPEISSSCTNSQGDAKLVDVATATNVNEVVGTKDEKTSPVPSGLFSNMACSVNAEGWTLIDNNDCAKDKTSLPQGNDTGAIPKTNIYPSLVANAEVQHEIPVVEVNASASAEETKPKEPLPATQDPTILNALAKMQQMGFTNEGGWLERLLITKDGNINAALDSLYPNARRQ